ncbi:MAG TPA: DNA mismatch repair endonuclease MutL, partial [Pirellulales bacterium]|nr:DNA mismatch repair endonuclease MutL [Pirellulales bacterium]
PVRRKFMRSMQTEMGHLSEAFTRLALAHPQVHFTLRHNNRPVYDLPPAEDWLQRIAALMGRELADELIWVESCDEPIRLAGYVARPSQSRTHNRLQYLFLNGRHIRDRSLQHALSEAYRGLLLSGRYPITFLRFDMPPELVDVNVHPTKLEVRFQDGGRLYSQLLGTLRTKFLATDLTHRIRTDEPEGPAAAHDPQVAQRLRGELVDWAKGQMASWPTPATAAERPAVPAWAPANQSRLEFNSLPARASQALDTLARPVLPAAASAEPALAEARVAVAAQFDPQSPVRALQIHDRYLVAESEEGVLVIDQHALHERILYEQIRDKVLAGALESQSLLVPDAVDLSAAEAALVAEHADLLARLGLRIDPFGGDTVLVTSYPAMLGKLKPVEVLRAVVDQLVGGGRTPERRDLLDELLHTIACKAAIKAGDRLSSEEVAALVELRHLAQDTHHCPHGRPTALVFTREELDRQFMRT